MSRTKLLIAACFAVFALVALASASASAATAGWDVNGTLLSGTVPLLSTALVLQEGVLKVEAGETLEIKCKAHEVLFNEGLLRSPDGITAKDVTFHGCQTVGSSAEKCMIPDLILTVAVHGLASLEGPLNTLIKVLPQTKTTFATIKFGNAVGSECALLGTEAVTGGLDLLLHEGFDPATLHLALAFSLTGSLKIGSSNAVLEGLDADLRLASGLRWNYL
jgi:hypothetical protein